MTAETPLLATPPPRVGNEPARPLDDPRAAQILATEHWSLLAGRSLAYNESFSRTGMFLTFLSASLIVIGFVVGTDRLADAIFPIVILLLAINLFLGLATVGRLVDANIEELATVRGMNRIRHAYSEMLPGIQRYFVSSIHDDMRGVLSTYGRIDGPQSPIAGVLHGLTTMIGMVAAIVCVVFGALVAVIALGLGASLGVALALGVAAFAASFGAFVAVGYRLAFQQPLFREAMFPSPPES